MSHIFRLVIFSSVCMLSSLSAQSELDDPPTSTSAAAQTADIDKQIDELKLERQRCKLMATLAERDASRVMTQDWMDYQAAVKRQEYFENRIKEIDTQIKELEQKKLRLQGHN